MPKPAWTYGIVLLAFAAGLAMGLYLGSGSSATPAATASTAPHADGFTSDEAREHYDQNVVFTKRIRELEEELAKRRANDVGVLADRLAFLKKYPNSISLVMVDQNLKVSDEAADFFQMTPGERSAVEQHLAQLRDKLKGELALKVTVTKQTATQVTFQIPAIPDESNLPGQLNDLLTADLGADRGAAFLQEGNLYFKNQLYDFGESPVEVQISQVDPKTNGNLPYQLKVSVKDGWGQGGFNGTLPPAYQGLIPFEPTPAH